MFLKLLGRVAAAGGILVGTATPAHAEWLEAKSAHFTVYGNMSESDLRNRTIRLERFDSLLRHILAPKETIPVTVYYVEGMSDVQAVMGDKSGGVAGFYNVDAIRAYTVIPKKLQFSVEDFTANIVMQHEYTHHMLLANAAVFQPVWAQEGLAELFATAKLEPNGSISMGYKNDSRGDAMFGMNRWTVRRLLESDLRPPQGDETIEAYARGWALIHYLWMSGQRPGQYVRFIEEINKGTPAVTAGEKVFGDLDKLNAEINHYINAHKFNTSRFSEKELGAPSVVTVRKLASDEAAILRYTMAVTVGVDEKTAGPLAERARPVGAAYPTSVPVQATLSEILYDAKDYAGAERAADKVLASAPDNLMGLADKGRAVFRQAMAKNDRAGYAKARGYFRQAARAHQGSAFPFMLYYDSFTAVGETPPPDAVAGLYRAVVLVPQDTELRIRAALALIQEGQVPRAKSVIAPAAFTPPEKKRENKSLTLVRQMEQTQDKQALLAKAKELKLDQVNDFIDPPKDDDKDADKKA